MNHLLKIRAFLKRFGQTRASRYVMRSIAAVFGAMLMFGLALYPFYRHERSRTAQEWTEKMPRQPRSPAEVQGIRLNMIRLRDLGVPVFLPQSMWDNRACAAAIVQLVNFLLGESRLLVDDAWKFSRTNARFLHLVFRRDDQFRAENGRIIETHDRGFWLSNILHMVGERPNRTTDRLYIVGYHYHATRSDRAILSAHQDMNSHLLLVLGRADGTWWGYHFFHDPSHPDANPFRIDDLGEQLPPQFDLMYVWELLGRDGQPMVLPSEGAPLALFNRTQPFADINRWLGWADWLGNAALSSYVDTALMAIAGDREQFPVMVDLSRSVAPVAPDEHHCRAHGQVLGFFDGQPIRCHREAENRRGQYGQEFQCVELINRYYATVLGHRNMTRTGHADTYFHWASDKGLVRFANGGNEPPRAHDVLVFDRDGPGGDPGHVALVTEVRGDRVCMVQQNTRSWRNCLSLTANQGSYNVEAMGTLPCVGWSRPRAQERTR